MSWKAFQLLLLLLNCQVTPVTRLVSCDGPCNFGPWDKSRVSLVVELNITTVTHMAGHRHNASLTARLPRQLIQE